MRMSPNFISVPCACAVSFRYSRGMEPVSKASYGIGGSWASRHEWKSRRMPLPTIPCSAIAVDSVSYNSSRSFDVQCN